MTIKNNRIAIQRKEKPGAMFAQEFVLHGMGKRAIHIALRLPLFHSRMEHHEIAYLAAKVALNKGWRRAVCFVHASHDNILCLNNYTQFHHMDGGLYHGEYVCNDEDVLYPPHPELVLFDSLRWSRLGMIDGFDEPDTPRILNLEDGDEDVDNLHLRRRGSDPEPGEVLEAGVLYRASELDDGEVEDGADDEPDLHEDGDAPWNESDGHGEGTYMFVLILMWAILAIEPLEKQPHIYFGVLVALIVIRALVLVALARLRLDLWEPLQ